MHREHEKCQQRGEQRVTNDASRGGTLIEIGFGALIAGGSLALVGQQTRFAVGAGATLIVVDQSIAPDAAVARVQRRARLFSVLANDACQ
jgi:hypothetical protein